MLVELKKESIIEPKIGDFIIYEALGNTVQALIVEENPSSDIRLLNLKTMSLDSWNLKNIGHLLSHPVIEITKVIPLENIKLMEL